MAKFRCPFCNRKVIYGDDHPCYTYMRENDLNLLPRLEEGEKINVRYDDDIEPIQQEGTASKLSNISLVTAREEHEMSLEESKLQSLNNDNKSFLDYLESVTYNALSDNSNVSVSKSLVNTPDSPPRNNDSDIQLITESGAVTAEHVSSEVHSQVHNKGEKMAAEVNASLSSMKYDNAVAGPSGMCNLKINISSSLCSKQLNKESNLVPHFQTPSGDNLVCSICKKSFRYKKTLVLHYKMHTGDKPFKCDKCESAFFQKANLIRHYRIHTGEKPFVCKKCGKKFTQKGNLDNHYLRHTNECPFVCDVCKKGFSKKSTLKGHILIHTGEKPFKCPVCEMLFNCKRNCNRHRKTVHK